MLNIDSIKLMFFYIIYFDRFIIFEKSLLEGIPLIEPKKNVKINIATKDDIKKIKFIGRRKVNFFLKRLQEKKICLIALHGEDTVYYRWMNFGRDNLVNIGEKDAYLFDAYTLPAYRHLRIHSAVTAECINICRKKGLEKVVATASVSNFPAQKTLRNLGFLEKGEVALFRIPWLNLQYKYVKYNSNFSASSV